jgi:hypothetical protein
VVVVVGAVEDDGPALEDALALGVGEVPLAELLEMTLVLMIAKSKRFPESTLKPARSCSGSSCAAIISRSPLSRPATFSASVRPVTVGTRRLSSRPGATR